MAEKPKSWGKSRIHWTKKRKIEDIERMIRDVEEHRIKITGRDTKEFLAHLRSKIEYLRS